MASMMRARGRRRLGPAAQLPRHGCSIWRSARVHARTAAREWWWRLPDQGGDAMVALIVLLLILAIFGGLGFAAHVLWWILIAALVLWAIGFLMAGAGAAGGRRGWYRW